MDKPNKTTDLEEYLKNGKLTEPFLDMNFLKQELKLISNNRKEKALDNDIEQCLLEFIHKNMGFCENENFVNKNIFMRTAKEIYESKIITGCTDYAYLFACLARQVGLPTTILQTVQKEWANKYINNIGNTKKHFGHTFCECFLNNKWVLIDPTSCCVDWQYEKYNTFKLELDWKIGNSRTFLPIYRGLDLGLRMDLSAYLSNENKLVKESFVEKLDTQLVKQRYEKIHSPEELITFMNDVFSYGWLDTEYNEHYETMKGIEKFKAMTIKEIFDYKIESCYEGAKFAKYWFDMHNMNAKIFFSRCKLKDIESNSVTFPDMHFFVLFEYEKDKWGRFEQVNKKQQGIFHFDSFDDAFKNIFNQHNITHCYRTELYKNNEGVIFTSGLYEFDKLEDDLTFNDLQIITDKKENLYIDTENYIEIESVNKKSPI